MYSRAALVLTALAVCFAAFPSVASAHNVRVSPRFGIVGDDFVFRGKAWQRFRNVRWFYDQSNDGSFDDSGRFFLTSTRFRFTWFNETVVDTHRMCFRQFDTRFDRVFFKCRRFTVLPSD